MLKERGDGLVVDASRLGRTRQAGEGNGCVWLGNGGAMLAEKGVSSGQGKKVVVFHGFEGAGDAASEGANSSRSDEGLRRRTAVRGRVDEGDVGRGKDLQRRRSGVEEEDQGEREQHKAGGGLTKVSMVESGKAPGACWP